MERTLVPIDRTARDTERFLPNSITTDFQGCLYLGDLCLTQFFKVNPADQKEKDAFSDAVNVMANPVSLSGCVPLRFMANGWDQAGGSDPALLPADVLLRVREVLNGQIPDFIKSYVYRGVLGMLPNGDIVLRYSAKGRRETVDYQELFIVSASGTYRGKVSGLPKNHFDETVKSICMGRSGTLYYLRGEESGATLYKIELVNP